MATGLNECDRCGSGQERLSYIRIPPGIAMRYVDKDADGHFSVCLRCITAFCDWYLEVEKCLSVN